MGKRPWIFLPGGRCKCVEHGTVTYGDVCRQCEPLPPRVPIADVALDVVPGYLNPVEEPYQP